MGRGFSFTRMGRLAALYNAIAGGGGSRNLYLSFRRDGAGIRELLARRARDGMDVRVVYDSLGSMDSDPAMFRMMEDAGVQVRVLEFHPLMPWRTKYGWRLLNRDHRKLVVADEDVAVLGGQNLGNEYGGSWVVPVPHETWRDTAIGLQGPDARLLAMAFERLWDYVERGGPIRARNSFTAVSRIAMTRKGRWSGINRARGDAAAAGGGVLPAGDDAGRAGGGCLGAGAGEHATEGTAEAAAGCATSLEMTMAYFCPPEELVEQFCLSAKQGVRVRLMLPERSDIPLS